MTVIIISLFFLFKKKEITVLIEPTKQTIEVIIDEPEESTALNKNTENNKVNKKEVTGTPDPIETFYDSDPYVDKILITYNHQFCYRELSQVKKSKRASKMMDLRLDDKQKAFLSEYKNYCEKINKQHPELKLSDQITFNKERKNIKATSYWGKIISHEIDAETLSDNEISAILKQNNLTILSQAPSYLKNYYQKIIHWGLEDILQNHQYNYADYVLGYAHQLYICNLGSDCSPTSTIMVALCYTNSLSCGLDYHQYIKTLLTQGQQADIQLALGYLQKQYQ